MRMRCMQLVVWPPTVANLLIGRLCRRFFFRTALGPEAPCSSSTNYTKAKRSHGKKGHTYRREFAVAN